MEARSALPSFLGPREVNLEKKLFFTCAGRTGAAQAREEWIGRTETMQFQFINCVSAPLKGANSKQEFALHERVTHVAGRRQRD
jgi:hypothetical protein